jgi:hypothetical protein
MKPNSTKRAHLVDRGQHKIQTKFVPVVADLLIWGQMLDTALI